VRRWIESSAQPELIDGVVVVDQLGAQHSRGPLVIGWSNDHKRTSIGLERTARNSLAQELGSQSMIDSFARQVPRVALPIALGGEGPLVAAGIDAVRVSGSGELDPRNSDQLNPDRYRRLCRGVMRLFGALNNGGKPGRGPDSYLTLGTKYLPGWAVSLLVLALMLPPLVASVDAFARARRQREPVGRWFGWLGAGFGALVLALLVAAGTVLVGLIPDPPPAPLQPALIGFDGSASTALVMTAVVALATWFVGRRWAAARLGLLERPGAGAGVAIGLSLAAIGVAAWVLNPYAALVIAPAVHAWLLAALTPVRRIPGLVLVVVGAVPMVLVVAYYVAHFDLGPLDAVWYAFLLVVGQQAGVLAALVGCALAALFVSTLVLVAVRPPEAAYGDGRRDRRASEPRLPILGPGGHAGPGSLGNTGSGVPR
jgi:MFS family permease